MLLYVIPAITVISVLSPSIINVCLKLMERRSPRQISLQGRIGELQAQLASMSMMDEFAAYARLQRQIANLQAEQNQHESQARISVIKLRLFLRSACYCITGVLMMYLMYVNSSHPVVQLPISALFPVSWLLAFPGCPSGSISVTAWLIICSAVVKRSAKAFGIS